MPTAKRYRSLFFILALLAFHGPAAAFDSSPMLGEIAITPYTFTPKNWMPCSGQSILIIANPALFSLLGTTYGGNGTTNFLLPNLNGALALGAGQGTGLSDRQLGDKGGQDTVIVNVNQLPAHIHTQTAMPLSSARGSVKAPATGAALAQAVDDEGSKVKLYVTSTATTSVGGVSLTASSGGGQPMNIRAPYLNLHYIICINGAFPSH